MPTQIELSEDGRYILVTQHGPVVVTQIKAARVDSLPLYQNECDRALVDFRLADMSNLKLIEIDDMGISVKQEVPKCARIAIVRVLGADDSRYVHLANAHKIDEIETELFDDMETAKTWLLKAN
jgi:hypothetical protein